MYRRELYDAEREIIRQFAAGSNALRDQAIRVYRLARRHGVYPESEPAMSFMHEIDNPVPDLALRAEMRKKLLCGKT